MSTYASAFGKERLFYKNLPGVVDTDGRDVVTDVSCSPPGVVTVVVFTSSVVMEGPDVVCVTVETTVVVFTSAQFKVKIFPIHNARQLTYHSSCKNKQFLPSLRSFLTKKI